MNIVRFHEPTPLSFRKSAGGTMITCDAHRDWVLPNAQIDKMMGDQQMRERVFKVSRIDTMLPNFSARHSLRPGASNRLLFYNGSGGYGDSIMSWPFTLIMAKMGYEVHVCIDPGNQMCWWNMPWIKSTHTLPMQHDVFQMFDHSFLLDAVVNTYEHPNQPHPLDCMLRKCGLNPNEIPAELKVVSPNFTASELAAAQQWVGRTFGIYQLASANPIRSLPPQDSAFMLSRLSEAYPHVTWLAVYDTLINEEYVKLLLVDDVDPATNQPRKTDKGEPVKKCKYPNVVLYFAPNLRELWAITSQAKVVVGPDSMMVHVAGSMGIPCVGFWGTQDPVSRVKYYKNHHAIFNTDVCPLAPCNHYLNRFPSYCPPRKDRNVCELLAAISPQQVFDAISKIAPNLVESAKGTP